MTQCIPSSQENYSVLIEKSIVVTFGEESLVTGRGSRQASEEVKFYFLAQNMGTQLCSVCETALNWTLVIVCITMCMLYILKTLTKRNNPIFLASYLIVFPLKVCFASELMCRWDLNARMMIITNKV